MRVAARAKAKKALPIEHNLLLTATLCLLAFGAVMVYSASSARALLQGQGEGTGVPRQVRHLRRARPRRHARHRAPRAGRRRAHHRPAARRRASCACCSSRSRASASSVNGARALARRRPAAVPAVRGGQARARPLRREGPRRAPGPRSAAPRDVMPLLLVAGAAVLLVASQPDLGTALVMCFTVTALLVAAGMPIRHLRRRRGRPRGARDALRAQRRVPARAPDDVPRPLGPRRRRRLPGRPGADRARLGRPLRARPRPVGPEDLLPARGPHRLHPGHHRRGARRRRAVRGALPLRAARLRRAARGQAGQRRLREAARRRRDVADPLPGAA